MRKLIDFGTMQIVIATDDQVSTEIDFDGLHSRWRQGVRSVGVYGPSALTGTARVKVNASLTDETTWVDLQDGGADVVVELDGLVVFDYGGWRRMRVESNMVEAADRDFVTVGVEDEG